jgi:PAS domain S-box-containing protein
MAEKMVARKREQDAPAAFAGGRDRTHEALTEMVRQKEVLYQLTDRLQRAQSFENVYDAALHAILSALPCDRASILLFDDAGIMRFVAWRGLSKAYRKVVEGHSPWPADEKNPASICIHDIETADLDASLKATIRAEGIGATAFVPLMGDGKLIGKFMTYFNAPHVFGSDEIELSMHIARQLAFAIERRRADELLAEELKATQLLHRLSTEMVQSDDTEALHKKIMEMAAAIMRSEYSSMQILHHEPGKAGELRLLAFNGLNPEAAKFWEWVRADSASACGEALRTRARVVVADVEKCDFMAGTAERTALLQAGIHAAQSTPLFSRGGELLGMISTHWRKPHHPSVRDLRLLDILARQAAELIERKQNEYSLRQSEARYRNVFKTVQVSIWEEDFSEVKRAIDGLKVAGVRDFRGYFAEHPEFVEQAIKSVCILDVNEATVKMFGASDKRQLLDSLDTIFVPETAAVFAEELLAIAEGRTFFEADELLRTVHGERVYAQVSIVFPPPHESFERVLVTVVDITERKRAEQALRESEEKAQHLANRLRLVTDAMPTLISYIDRHRHYRFVNKAYQDWFGYKPEAVLGKTMQEVLGEAAYQRLQPHVEAALGGRPVHFEAQIPYKKGGTRSILGEYVPDIQPDGSVAGIYVLVQDISARKQADEALHRSEELLRAIFNTTAVGVALLTDDARFLQANEAFCAITGHTIDELSGLESTALTHPDDIERMQALISDLQAERRQNFAMEKRYIRKDGTTVWVLNSVSAVYDDTGSVSHLVKLCQDITERKKVEQSLHEADRRKDEFLATLSHELRNPLAPIRQAAKLLQSPQLGERDARWARDVIDRQVAVMGWLLDDLLDISRISSGKLELRKEPVDLASVVESALELARPLIEAKQHALHIELPAEPLWLEADPLRLAQIISNLLTNAAKYTDPKGLIRLRAEREGKELAVRVSDNGIGISAGMLPKIFEMFSQATPMLERTEGGLGIGLALVRGFAALHGGSVQAHSDGPGKGSEFTLRLPLGVVSGSRSKTQSATTDAQPVTGRKVLVVDDNRDAAETLSTLIRLYGCEVMTSFNGLEALEVAEVFQPDVALLDIGMPGLNGYEMAQQIRQRLWGKRMRLIAVTGWGQEDDKRRAMAAGFDYHLRKPIDSDSLKSLLKVGGKTLDASSGS